MGEFHKVNHSGYPQALQQEAAGLGLLSAALAEAGVAEVRVPEVLSVSETDLVTERISAGKPTPELMRVLGRGLARLHALKMASYGLDHDNMIGLNPQHNDRCSEWGQFFIDCRLKPQIDWIRDNAQRYWMTEQLDRYRHRLQEFLNEHCAHPSLLHGDLWSGNVLFDGNNPWLIDPAVYHGDREADLAMTELFGGFGREFYDAYDEVYPRTDVYPLKRSIYNLYHTLNHLNLFGSSYWSACQRNAGALGQL